MLLSFSRVHLISQHFSLSEKKMFFQLIHKTIMGAIQFIERLYMSHIRRDISLIMLLYQSLLQWPNSFAKHCMEIWLEVYYTWNEDKQCCIKSFVFSLLFPWTSWVVSSNILGKTTIALINLIKLRLTHNKRLLINRLAENKQLQL